MDFLFLLFLDHLLLICFKKERVANDAAYFK